MYKFRITIPLNHRPFFIKSFYDINCQNKKLIIIPNENILNDLLTYEITLFNVLHIWEFSSQFTWHQLKLLYQDINELKNAQIPTNDSRDIIPNFGVQTQIKIIQ